MLIAQGLGEYGALAGGSSTRFSEVVDPIGGTLQSMEPSTWAMVLGALLIIWFLFFRK